MSCLGLQGVELQLCRAAEAAEQAAAAANALRDREGWTDAVQAVADAIATLLLPLLALYVAWRLSPLLARIVERRSFSIKIAGFELSAQEATDQLRAQIEDLQSKVAALALPAAAPAVVDNGKTIYPSAPPPPAPAPARDRGGPGDADIFAPAPPSPQPARPRTPAPPLPAPEDPAPGAAARPAPRRILWVDDRPENNAVVIAGLIEAGVEVETVGSTAEALRALQGPPRHAAVVSDLGRREGIAYRREAGIRLVRDMRDAGIDLPVAIFTSSHGLRGAPEARAVGAALVTASPTELRRFIDSHLEGSRAD